MAGVLDERGIMRLTLLEDHKSSSNAGRGDLRHVHRHDHGKHTNCQTCDSSSYAKCYKGPRDGSREL
jgi:hypothetical protein